MNQVVICTWYGEMSTRGCRLCSTVSYFTENSKARDVPRTVKTASVGKIFDKQASILVNFHPWEHIIKEMCFFGAQTKSIDDLNGT